MAGHAAADAASLTDVHEYLRTLWPRYLESLSRWDFTRLFRKDSGTLRFKPVPDVIVVSPLPRLAKAKRTKEWYDGCRTALLTYCNHGPDSKTFRDEEDLKRLGDEGSM